jgi:polysaccharide deacetylase family protein (PEP-CTERM system associated)
LPLNAISVDVEDWVQSVFDAELPLTERFAANTRRVLEAFATGGVRGTFFVLGLAAEKNPGLIREIHEAGHEVQSHGYGHRHVHTLTPTEFRQDLDRSRKLLEDILGAPVTGYRAPAFTITLRSLWALDVLVEAGFRYDSSIFPLRVRFYGISGVPRFPHRLRTPSGYELTEVPVASWRCCERLIPVGGGGYFRLFPYAVLSSGVRQLNAAGHPAVIYMHPYEYDPAGFDELPVHVPFRLRLHQGLGRRGFPRKIDRLLTEFRFGSISDVIAAQGDLPLHENKERP